jgi:hypothetical protein
MPNLAAVILPSLLVATQRMPEPSLGCFRKARTFAKRPFVFQAQTKQAGQLLVEK